VKNIALITRREIAAFLRTPGGYVIAAAVLLVDALLFNGFALGSTPKLSSQVLQDFFFFASGTTMIAAVFLSMRLLAEERQTGTITLLFTSPVRESEVVISKFLSAFAFLAVLTLLTLYMPALIFVNGKVSVGHITAGYLGLLLLGAACLALGTLGSTLARNQLVAAVISAAFVVTMLLCWLLARIADPPMTSIIAYMSLFDEHYRPFQRGMLRLSDVVFYVSVMYFALLAATRVLQTQRYR
jgi:ABC-2 type transport system permease protein